MAKAKPITIHDIQAYVSRGAHLHPILKETFEQALYELYVKGYVSFMPITILERFNTKVEATQKVIVRRRKVAR